MSSIGSVVDFGRCVFSNLVDGSMCVAAVSFSIVKEISKIYGNVLFNGFVFQLTDEEQRGGVPVQWKHFHPSNTWEKKDNVDVIDKTTGDLYWNEKNSTVRLKCAALFVGTLMLQVVALILNLVNRIAKVVTFSHFWPIWSSQGKYPVTARLEECKRDMLIIVTTPLIWVGMLLSSLYGAIPSPFHSPFDGRKLYATLERFAYSGSYQRFALDQDREGHDIFHPQTHFLAPCFQPSRGKINHRYHAFHGENGAKTAW